MKIRYDRSVVVAYLSVADETSRPTSFGFTYACNPTEVGDQIHLDFDGEGRLIGIEVLNASKLLPLSLIPKDL